MEWEGWRVGSRVVWGRGERGGTNIEGEGTIASRDWTQYKQNRQMKTYLSIFKGDLPHHGNTPLVQPLQQVREGRHISIVSDIHSL